MKQTFSTTDVGVVLTGEEWFTILATLTGKRDALSPEGAAIYRKAAKSLQKQILAVSERLK